MTVSFWDLVLDSSVVLEVVGRRECVPCLTHVTQLLGRIPAAVRTDSASAFACTADVSSRLCPACKAAFEDEVAAVAMLANAMQHLAELPRKVKVFGPSAN